MTLLFSFHWCTKCNILVILAIMTSTFPQRVERQQKEKLTKHLAEMKKDMPTPVADKPLFKIKKFTNVGPKIVNS